MTPMDDASGLDAKTTTPLTQRELDVLTDKLIDQLSRHTIDLARPRLRPTSCSVF